MLCSFYFQWLEENRYRIYGVKLDKGLRYFYGRFSKPNITLRDEYKARYNQHNLSTDSSFTRQCPTTHSVDRFGRCQPLQNFKANGTKPLGIDDVHRHVEHGVRWINQFFPGFE